mmetsp:Transcript_40339/g.79570  ORF Transcript_40339/g.79570 Transcript_40339/m.79570 type:complete len:105 (-) Transcript_40339:53-367(-)
MHTHKDRKTRTDCTDGRCGKKEWCCIKEGIKLSSALSSLLNGHLSLSLSLSTCTNALSHTVRQTSRQAGLHEDMHPYMHPLHFARRKEGTEQAEIGTSGRLMNP